MTLGQVAKIIKSEWLLIGLGIISISVLVLATISFLKPKETPPSSPHQALWQESIAPGKTTRQELETKLGPPTKTEESQNGEIYYYSSPNEFLPHKVILADDKVSQVKEQIIKGEEGALEGYLQRYGQPQAKLYGRHGTIAPGHFWGEYGILVFANEFDGGILEIWYFAPTDLNAFLAQNPELKTEQPTTF